MSGAPPWAEQLVAIVCAEAAVAPPRLLWRRRSGMPSTGVARRGDGTIAVRAGSDPVDQRLTLLHELAHWLTPPARRRRAPHHGAAFYATAFSLYRRHGIHDADALRLEASRYPSALRHAVTLDVPGARGALDDRLASLRGRRASRTWRVAVPEHPVQLVREGRWHVCAACGQRVVGRTLARVRRARRASRHVLWTAVPIEDASISA
jgi:hypothetical protein